jgi:hypothetical protein
MSSSFDSTIPVFILSSLIPFIHSGTHWCLASFHLSVLILSPVYASLHSSIPLLIAYSLPSSLISFFHSHWCLASFNIPVATLCRHFLIFVRWTFSFSLIHKMNSTDKFRNRQLPILHTILLRVSTIVYAIKYNSFVKYFHKKALSSFIFYFKGTASPD